ncbi:MAG: nucleotidyltransferase domain-containing protein, partial [Thermoplasmata archaeon]
MNVWDRKIASVLSALSLGPLHFTALRTTLSNPRTLSLKLHELNALGWIAQNGREYRLTPVGERAGQLMAELLALSQTRDEIRVDRIPHPSFVPIIRWVVEKLRDQFSTMIRGILVFGSVARGDWSADSDIDLLILVSGAGPEIEVVREGLLDIQRDLRLTPWYRNARRVGLFPVIDGHFI